MPATEDDGGEELSGCELTERLSVQSRGGSSDELAAGSSTKSKASSFSARFSLKQRLSLVDSPGSDSSEPKRRTSNPLIERTSIAASRLSSQSSLAQSSRADGSPRKSEGRESVTQQSEAGSVGSTVRFLPFLQAPEVEDTGYHMPLWQRIVFQILRPDHDVYGRRGLDLLVIHPHSPVRLTFDFIAAMYRQPHEHQPDRILLHRRHAAWLHLPASSSLIPQCRHLHRGLVAHLRRLCAQLVALLDSDPHAELSGRAVRAHLLLTALEP